MRFYGLHYATMSLREIKTYTIVDSYILPQKLQGTVPLILFLYRCQGQQTRARLYLH